jgi:hypothetical protein
MFPIGFTTCANSRDWIEHGKIRRPGGFEQLPVGTDECPGASLHCAEDEVTGPMLPSHGRSAQMSMVGSRWRPARVRTAHSTARAGPQTSQTAGEPAEPSTAQKVNTGAVVGKCPVSTTQAIALRMNKQNAVTEGPFFLTIF